MKLSAILRKFDELKVDRQSYIYGTIMNICGFPYFYSLYDRRTGLISPIRNAQANYYEPMLYAIKRAGIKYLVFRMGRKMTDIKIKLDAIEVDLTLDEINSKKYLQTDK